MLHTFQAWLEQTPLSPYVRDVVWAKALLESVHILADAVVLFSAGAIGVQLLVRGCAGPTLRRQAPWLWGGLCVAAATGLVLLTGAGRRGLDNPLFIIKLGALGSAVALTATIQLAAPSTAPATGSQARRWTMALAGPLCFLLWVATVFAGRFLAYSASFFAPSY